MYIGETRRTVHERVNELRHTIKRKDLMPWNDPHTAAPSLWAWQEIAIEHLKEKCAYLIDVRGFNAWSLS
jgi:hypothetical protein